tara:strand:+ start:574 stop:1632 length:1059 start_codon:yes stop_codon:yes gene_type:complete
MTDDIFRKRPILGSRILTPVRDEEDGKKEELLRHLGGAVELSAGWSHPSGHAEGWVGKYKKMDIEQFDCGIYWKDYTDWCDQVLEYRTADSHGDVKIKWVSRPEEEALPILGWTKKVTPATGAVYLVIRMDRAKTDGEVHFYVSTYHTAAEFDKAMSKSEKIHKANTTLNKCQLYGEMIAQYLVTNWYCEAVESYWHEDEDCDWSDEYDVSRRSEILDMQVEKTLANLWSWEEDGVVSYDFYWRMRAAPQVIDLNGAAWLNTQLDEAPAEVKTPTPAQVGGEPINVATYISYKDKRSPVRVNLTKGEINSHCVEEVKCKLCMQTVIVSYLAVKKSRQKTKCPACKAEAVHFG